MLTLSEQWVTCMPESREFLESTLNAMKDHIVVIDHTGNILFVNNAWTTFGKDNSCPSSIDWKNTNYLEVCENSASTGDEFGRRAADGITDVISANSEEFYLEYPCHSQSEKHWFMMQVTPFNLKDHRYFVISHRDITKRKLAENKVLTLSRIDGLTEVSNRRHFDEYLDFEWERCARLRSPISLAMIDIDHFKILNDTYGHQAGDSCLKKIAGVLKTYTQRPSDMCARYGGEEFAIVYGNTDADHAQMLIKRLMKSIRDLRIPNEESPITPYLTISIGLITMYSHEKNNATMLIKAADQLLYQAKDNGRNQVSYKQEALQAAHSDT